MGHRRLCYVGQYKVNYFKQQGPILRPHLLLYKLNFTFTNVQYKTLYFNATLYDLQ